jgi:hypothetical protein
MFGQKASPFFAGVGLLRKIPFWIALSHLSWSVTEKSEMSANVCQSLQIVRE